MLSKRGAIADQPLQQIETGQNRHGDVDKRDVRLFGQDGLKTFLAVKRDADPEASINQLLGDQARGFAIVVDTQHVRM